MEKKKKKKQKKQTKKKKKQKGRRPSECAAATRPFFVWMPINIFSPPTAGAAPPGVMVGAWDVGFR